MNSAKIYPNCAGSKGEAETGKDAAAAMNLHLGRVQQLVADTVEAAGARGMTPEELSEATGLERTTVQPRTSELRAKGILRDSGQRRLNRSRKRAIVWVYVPKDERAALIAANDPEA